jgi:hypothetical protein
MFAVLTTVNVEEGSIPELAALFDATNRRTYFSDTPLVARDPVGAR